MANITIALPDRFVSSLGQKIFQKFFAEMFGQYHKNCCLFLFWWVIVKNTEFMGMSRWCWFSNSKNHQNVGFLKEKQEKKQHSDGDSDHWNRHNYQMSHFLTLSIVFCAHKKFCWIWWWNFFWKIFSQLRVNWMMNSSSKYHWFRAINWWYLKIEKRSFEINNTTLFSLKFYIFYVPQFEELKSKIRIWNPLSWHWHDMA